MARGKRNSPARWFVACTGGCRRRAARRPAETRTGFGGLVDINFPGPVYLPSCVVRARRRSMSPVVTKETRRPACSQHDPSQPHVAGSYHFHIPAASFVLSRRRPGIRPCSLAGMWNYGLRTLASGRESFGYGHAALPAPAISRRERPHHGRVQRVTRRSAPR